LLKNTNLVPGKKKVTITSCQSVSVDRERDSETRFGLLVKSNSDKKQLLFAATTTTVRTCGQFLWLESF